MSLSNYAVKIFTKAVMAVSLQSTAHESTKIATQNINTDLFWITLLYNRMTTKNNTELKISARPTKPATDSVCIGCTVNSKLEKYATSSMSPSNRFLRKNSSYMGTERMHKSPYKITLVA